MRKPIVFGSEYASYTTKLNYEQCKYRLYLMGDKEANQDRVEIFPPMLRGLVLHKAMEVFFTENRHADFDEIYTQALFPSREEVDWGMRKVVWYPPYEEQSFIQELKDELVRFQSSLPQLQLPEYQQVVCEWEVERSFQGVLMRGHIDIAFKLPSGRWICGDLKTGKYDYNSEQFLFYNWLVNGFLRYPHPFFIFVWDGNQLQKKVVLHHMSFRSPTLMRLLWQMVEMQTRLSEIQAQIEQGVHPAKLLRPNIRHFTCHQHRCSFWNECEYGRRKSKDEQDTDTGDLV